MWQQLVTMRDKVLIASANICQDDGQEWTLEYFLQTFEGLGGEDLYSLRVDKKTLKGDLAESEETFTITNSYGDALAMAEAFAAGTVPPSVLLEMADEWLTEVAIA